MRALKKSVGTAAGTACRVQVFEHLGTCALFKRGRGFLDERAEGCDRVHLLVRAEANLRAAVAGGRWQVAGQVTGAGGEDGQGRVTHNTGSAPGRFHCVSGKLAAPGCGSANGSGIGAHVMFYHLRPRLARVQATTGHREARAQDLKLHLRADVALRLVVLGRHNLADAMPAKQQAKDSASI